MAAITLVVVFAILDLVGWALGIPILKSFVPGFMPMRIVTAVALLFSAVATVCIAEIEPLRWKRRLSLVCCATTGLFSLLTIAGYLFDTVAGQPWQQTHHPALHFFLDPAARMPVVTAVLFFLYAWVVVLLARHHRRFADAGHALLISVSMVSYLIIMGYLFDIRELYVWRDVAVAFTTSIAFFGLCIASFCIRPRTWLMNVFTSEGAGADMARRLLPFMLFLPLVIGWFRLQGERHHFFSSESGVAIVAVTYTICFLLLLWMNARAVNRTDQLRRDAEVAVRKNIKMLNRAEEIARLGSWELDAINKRLYWSDEAYRIFGIEPQSLEVTYETFLEAIHPDDRTAVDAAYTTSIGSGCDTYEIEYRVVQKSTGNIRSVYEKCEHQRDGEGKIIRSTGMVHDVTDRRETEELLQENEMKILGRLTSGVAHEVRNPLNGILAIMGALSRELNNDTRFQPYMQHMKNQVTRLTVLMEDLLVLGRPLRKEILTEVSMVTLVENTLATWLPTIPASGPSVRLVAPEDRDRYQIQADVTSMTQVIINLLENAHHHSPEGMEIVCAIKEGHTGDVVFSVKDRGTGIPAQILPKIFDPFFTTRKGGTGLGLSIVRRIVDNHQGSVSAVNNSDGSGATFEVIIPRNKPSGQTTIDAVSVFPKHVNRRK